MKTGLHDRGVCCQAIGDTPIEFRHAGQNGGYVEKPPFLKPQTDVRVQELQRHDDTGEVTLKLTPVHGGVGLLTITMLMHNTLKAAQNRIQAAGPRPQGWARV